MKTVFCLRKWRRVYHENEICGENTFYGGATFTGVYNKSLLFDINMSSVSHYLGGGYILLNEPDSS